MEPFTIIHPKSFSNKENKYLQGFPNINYNAIISRKFTKEFETFTTDQFIFRNNWIGLKTICDLSLLKKDNGRVYFGRDGYLFDIDKEVDKEQLEKNIDSINAFLAKMKELKIPVSGLLVSSKSTVLDNKLPNHAPVIDEKEITSILKNKLNPQINLIELDKVLGNKSDKYIYYKTDHHWTTKGAFYAYEYYMKSMEQEALREEEFNIKEVSKDFWGTNYRKTNYYKGDPDSIFIYERDQMIEGLYDKSFLNKTDKYSCFLGGDKGLI